MIDYFIDFFSFKYLNSLKTQFSESLFKTDKNYLTPI